jgi:hypothetical protein
MFTSRRTILRAVAGAVAVAALCLAALTGATPAAHAAALTPGANAATVAAPQALSPVRSASGAMTPADQSWQLYTTFSWWDPNALDDCVAIGTGGYAGGSWSLYYCLPTWSGVQLWVLPYDQVQ